MVFMQNVASTVADAAYPSKSIQVMDTSLTNGGVARAAA
jgi:hypothetical protein